MDYKWVDIERYKNLLKVVGFLGLLGAIVMMIIVPMVKSYQFERSINTHYQQAEQAANPSEFSLALRNLDKALVDNGMAEGRTGISGSENGNMKFKREQFLLLADRADAISSNDLGSLQVSIGNSELKSSLENISTNTYGFWLYNQGGVWFQYWIPLAIMLVSSVVGLVGIQLPWQIRVKVKTPLKAS